MIKRSVSLQWFAVGVVGLLVVGCKPDDSTSTTVPTSGTTADAKKPVKLAFITNGTDPFWTIAKKGIDKETSEDPNVSVDFREIPTGTPAEQKQELDNEAVKGVQGIAISVKNPAQQVDMVNDAAKKALIFTQDSDAPDTNRACYVGTDNVTAGKEAGAEILKALPNGGKIMLFVGDKDAGNAKDRFAGVQEALKDSKVTILGVRTDDGDRVRAKANVSDTIVANPDIACLVGLWSYNGPAILNAVKDAHKIGTIKIVCFDEAEDTLGGIKDGSISATVVQQPFEFGYEACKMMAQVIRGDKSVIPANKIKYVPTKVITKDSVDAFWADLKKLTGKS
jgi:ribose transport system substrate-binding protein